MRVGDERHAAASRVLARGVVVASQDGMIHATGENSRARVCATGEIECDDLALGARRVTSFFSPFFLSFPRWFLPLHRSFPARQS